MASKYVAETTVPLVQFRPNDFGSTVDHRFEVNLEFNFLEIHCSDTSLNSRKTAPKIARWVSKLQNLDF